MRHLVAQSWPDHPAAAYRAKAQQRACLPQPAPPFDDQRDDPRPVSPALTGVLVCRVATMICSTVYTFGIGRNPIPGRAISSILPSRGASLSFWHSPAGSRQLRFMVGGIVLFPRVQMILSSLTAGISSSVTTYLPEAGILGNAPDDIQVISWQEKAWHGPRACRVSINFIGSESSSVPIAGSSISRRDMARSRHPWTPSPPRDARPAGWWVQVRSKGYHLARAHRHQVLPAPGNGRRR